MGSARSIVVVSLSCSGTACQSIIVQTDYLEEVSVMPSTRPLPDAYAVNSEPSSARACEDEVGRVEMQTLIDAAQGDFDAMVQVTIEKRVVSDYKVATNRNGRVFADQVIYDTEGRVLAVGEHEPLVGRRVCWDVSGLPVRFAK